MNPGSESTLKYDEKIPNITQRVTISQNIEGANNSDANGFRKNDLFNDQNKSIDF
jgi:hypothetical protein